MLLFVTKMAWIGLTRWLGKNKELSSIIYPRGSRAEIGATIFNYQINKRTLENTACFCAGCYVQNGHVT